MQYAPVRRPFRRVQVNAPLLLLVLACTAAAVTLAALRPFGHPSVVLWLCLTLGTGALEAAVARFSTGAQRWTMSVTEAVLVVVLLLAPGTWVLLPGAVGMLVAQVLRRKRDPWKVSFNVTMYGAAFALAGSVAQALGGGIVGALVGVLAFWAVNFVLVACAVRMTTPTTFRALVLQSLPLSLFHMLVNLSVGLTAAVMVTVHPLTLLGLLVPLAAILRSYETITRRVDEAGLLDRMLMAQDDISARPTEEYAQVILRAAADIFDSAEVEMLVLRNSDEPLLLTLEPATGGARVALATAEDLDQQWVLRALASPTAVAVDHALTRAWATIRIGDAERPLALVAAYKPVGSETGVSRRDQRLARLLAQRAARWLSAAAGGGPTGEGELAAAQAALRSAAYRLVHAADRLPEWDTQALVTELHRVERAVAGVLGAGRTGAAGQALLEDVPELHSPAAALQATSTRQVPPQLATLAARRAEAWVTLPTAAKTETDSAVAS